MPLGSAPASSAHARPTPAVPTRRGKPVERRGQQLYKSLAVNTIQRTEVCITVDTEFSIGGCFRDPTLDPVGPIAAECTIDGASHGLGFLLDELAETRLAATFFVEALNVHFFGDDVMGGIAERIHAAGHDLQLHTHPCWRTFRNPAWREAVRTDPPGDAMAGRTVEDVVDILRDGLATFERWALPRPVALRTGSLSVDRTVYRGMAEVGLPLASNIGCGVYPPADATLHLPGGRHRIEGIVEVPVLTYEDVSLGTYRHLKNWTITGCSSAETRSLLESARRLGVETVVLLTHPFEFAKHDERFTRLKPNRINQRRFRNLCRFLADRSDEFNVVTFGGHERWRTAPDRDDPMLKVGLHRTIQRLVENRLNDAF